jgi:hypothetical protein
MFSQKPFYVCEWHLGESRLAQYPPATVVFADPCLWAGHRHLRVIVIYLIGRYELSFDSFHPDADRIYRIVGDVRDNDAHSSDRKRGPEIFRSGEPGADAGPEGDL